MFSAAKDKKSARNARLKKVALWTGAGLLTYELFMALIVRRQNRRDVYNQAVARANETQKSLVVVGNPDAGFVSSTLGRDYDCGELCIDERGCARCKNQAVATLEKALPTLPSNSAVIFVSGTLEYVKDLAPVLAELNRVSGGDLYISNVQPWTLTAFAYPGAQRRIVKAPPDGNVVAWKALPWRNAEAISSFTVQPSLAASKPLFSSALP